MASAPWRDATAHPVFIACCRSHRDQGESMHVTRTDHPLRAGQTRQHPDRPDTDVARPAHVVVFVAIPFGLTWLAFLPMILGHVDPASTAGFFLLLLGIGAPSLTGIAM